MVNTSNWDRQLVDLYESFTASIGGMSTEYLRQRIMMAEVDMEDPVLRGEAECCAATIEAAQAELARRG